MRVFAIILGAAAALGGALWLARPERASAPLEADLRLAEPGSQASSSVLETADALDSRSTCAEPFAAAPHPDAGKAVRDLGNASAGPQWMEGARANAAGLDAEALSALARNAANPATPPFERCAAAELLRHMPDATLPPDALAFLRRCFEQRESEPLLALAAVRSLASFGGREDRAQLLDEAAQSSSLAIAGLSCMRGDEAARELAAIASETRDAQRANAALAALASMAASDEGGLTPRARAECAALLDSSPFDDEREARRLCALRALEPPRPR